MRAIYEPQGRAYEYSPLACNLYSGCEFGCLYCYAPAVLHQTRDQFTHPRPRIGVIPQIEADCKRLIQIHEVEKHVLFCFTCDPYQPTLHTQYHLMTDAMRILQKYRIPINILTKSHTAREDFYLLNICKYPRFGMTLTFTDMAKSRKMEPLASDPTDRFLTLQEAKYNYSNIQTWASLEPIIDVDETIGCIKATHEYVDHYKVGKWNHTSEQRDWPDIRQRVIGVLEDYGCNYILKKDLKQAK